jgi:COP9 signalosome complex subunit 1
MGNEDLGNHYQQMGDLTAAGKAFQKMREYCTIAKHVIDLNLKVIAVSVEQRNYLSIQTAVNKIRGTQMPAEEEKRIAPVLYATMGLAFMASGRCRDAAESFISTDPSIEGKANQYITMNDIAVYGGLCALATMNRSELKNRVLENSNFRTFLELESHIRMAIKYFCSSKYSQCLEVLESYKTDYLLDVHLHGQLNSIYTMVRRKCIVQYFVPFSCVSLTTMAEAFTTTKEKLEVELVELIESNLLNARIDTLNSVSLDTCVLLYCY